jgi:hypothetical protein
MSEVKHTPHTECVEDLQDLIFNPTLDAGIELQKRMALVFEQRAMLLEALQMAVEWIEEYRKGDNALQTLRDAHAAIARATGSQQ